ncbi:MAG TPA: tetratricopeptide repeat protein [Elusimicrobiota bacterium]|nr:tetratricopeptide repeat protein [Elusimicrobiota bacterium]
MKRGLQRGVLVAAGVLLSLALAEIGLRFAGSLSLRRQERRNMRALSAKGTYRILCLGESTTAYGGENSYPSQLEKILNARAGGVRFAVVNRGVPGTDSARIADGIDDNLDRYAPAMVVTMMGANEETVAAQKRAAGKQNGRPWWDRFGMGRLVESVVGGFSARAFPGEGMEQVRNERGERLVYEGRYDEAEEFYRKAIARDPQGVKARLELAALYLRQDRFQEAESLLKKVSEIEPKNVEAVRLSAMGLRFQGRPAEAEKRLRAAMDNGIDDVILYVELSLSCAQQSRCAEAERVLVEKIAAGASPAWPAIHRLANFLLGREEYEETEKLLRELMVRGYEDHRAWGLLATLMQEQGKYGLAEEFYAKSTALRKAHANQELRRNYRVLRDKVRGRGIRLVCVQYPVRDVGPLVEMLAPDEGVFVVDNEKLFKEALKKYKYAELFKDRFGGDFGHGTPLGNRLLAENVAETILAARSPEEGPVLQQEGGR